MLIVYEEEKPIEIVDYDGWYYHVTCPNCGDKKSILPHNYMGNGKKCSCGMILKNNMAYKKYKKR